MESTIGLSNWAVDLKDVGAVYPFQGLEIPMVIAGVVFWLWFHLAQMSQESRAMRAAKEAYKGDRAREAADRY